MVVPAEPITFYLAAMQFDPFQLKDMVMLGVVNARIRVG